MSWIVWSCPNHQHIEMDHKSLCPCCGEELEEYEVDFKEAENEQG